MNYSYVSAWPWFYPFPANGSFYVLPVLIQNLCILHRNQLNFSMHHCIAGLLRINYLWTCVVIFGKGYWEITDLVTFFFIANCSTIVLKFLKCTICDGIHWNLGEMTKSRNVCEKTLFGVLEMNYSYVSAGPWFYPISCKWLFLCSTCLDSEPLHFASESVEFFHAWLYRWCLKNNLTLDLSRYICKRLLGDNRCCNFFPHC